MLRIRVAPMQMKFIQIAEGRVFVLPLYRRLVNGCEIDLGNAFVSPTVLEGANYAAPFETAVAYRVPFARPSPPAVPSALPPSPPALPFALPPSPPAVLSALLPSPPAVPSPLKVVLSEHAGPTRRFDEDDDEVPPRIRKRKRSNWERIGPSATTARKSTFVRYPKQTAHFQSRSSLLTWSRCSKLNVSFISFFFVFFLLCCVICVNVSCRLLFCVYKNFKGLS